MTWLATLLLRLHRLLLILGTVFIALAASRIANGTSAGGAWLVLAGGALMMYLAEVASEIEMTSARLSKSSDVSIEASRRDLLSSRRPWVLVAIAANGVALIVLGLLV